MRLNIHAEVIVNTCDLCILLLFLWGNDSVPGIGLFLTLASCVVENHGFSWWSWSWPFTAFFQIKKWSLRSHLVLRVYEYLQVKIVRGSGSKASTASLRCLDDFFPLFCGYLLPLHLAFHLSQCASVPAEGCYMRPGKWLDCVMIHLDTHAKPSSLIFLGFLWCSHIFCFVLLHHSSKFLVVS